MKNENDMITNAITLGSCLTLLYNLSNLYYRSQQEYYRALFGGYHRMVSELYQEENWVLNQGTVSRILSDRQPMPWEQRKYYMLGDGDYHLATDVRRYLDTVVRTAKQCKDHMDQLTALVEASNNLDPADKQHILAYALCQERTNCLSWSIGCCMYCCGIGYRHRGRMRAVIRLLHMDSTGTGGSRGSSYIFYAKSYRVCRKSVY